MRAKLLQPCPTLCDPRTVASQASLSMGFSRQEYWSGLPCTPPGDLPDPGIELTSLRSPALAGGLFTTSTIWQQVYLDDVLTVFTDLAVISHLDDTRGLNFSPSSTLVLRICCSDCLPGFLSSWFCFPPSLSPPHCPSVSLPPHASVLLHACTVPAVR